MKTDPTYGASPITEAELLCLKDELKSNTKEKRFVIIVPAWAWTMIEEHEDYTVYESGKEKYATNENNFTATIFYKTENIG